jgi:hypothetical protein
VLEYKRCSIFALQPFADSSLSFRAFESTAPGLWGVVIPDLCFVRTDKTSRPSWMVDVID